jgi:hypothetical protein
MKRIIIDYKKLTQHILDLLIEKFPDGYAENDIIVFRNAQNEIVEAVEVRTEDTIYLVKVSQRLIDSMESHEDDVDDDIMDSDDNENTDVDDLIEESEFD